MKVTMKIWSDNYGYDETFGTKPNVPHLMYIEDINIDGKKDLSSVIISSFRNKMKDYDAKLGISIFAKTSMLVLRKYALKLKTVNIVDRQLNVFEKEVL